MTGDQVVAELARIKPPPASLAVYVDGVAEPKRVPIPNVRKRWARVAAVVEQLPWLVIEAHDKQGGLVGGPWKSDDDGAPPPAVGAGLTIREREIAEVVLASFKQAHAMFLGMFGSLLGSVKTQMEAMTATSRHLTTSYERLMVVQRQTLELQSQGAPPAADDDDDGMAQLLGIVETLAKREQGAPGPPKNGNPPPRKKSTEG